MPILFEYIIPLFPFAVKSLCVYLHMLLYARAKHLHIFAYAFYVQKNCYFFCWCYVCEFTFFLFLCSRFHRPTAIIELGTATGFDFELIDQANLGHTQLTQARNQLLGMVKEHPDLLVRVRPNGLEDTPQFKLDVDQEKAQALGVSLSDVNQTISTALGGTYVNDFIDHGRVKKVYVQADAKFRMLPGDINNLYVRSANGEMVPFSAFSNAHWVYGSPRLERYNGMPSMEILGESAPGKSTGEAMAMMESLAAKLPSGIGYDWTGMSYQERLSGNQAPALYAISLIVVFLCLAALYESWCVFFILHFSVFRIHFHAPAPLQRISGGPAKNSTLRVSRFLPQIFPFLCITACIGGETCCGEGQHAWNRSCAVCPTGPTRAR